MPFFTICRFDSTGAGQRKARPPRPIGAVRPRRGVVLVGWPRTKGVLARDRACGFRVEFHQTQHALAKREAVCGSGNRFFPLYMNVLFIGWGGRIRTSAWRYQKPLPYHLATPHNYFARPRADAARRNIIARAESGNPRSAACLHLDLGMVSSGRSGCGQQGAFWAHSGEDPCPCRSETLSGVSCNLRCSIVAGWSCGRKHGRPAPRLAAERLVSQTGCGGRAAPL